MSRILNPTYKIDRARASLQRRINGAATRRFVASAQRALPRDGTVTHRNSRRLIARLARRSRKTNGGLGGKAQADVAPREARLHRQRASHYAECVLTQSSLRAVLLIVAPRRRSVQPRCPGYQQASLRDDSRGV